MGIPQNTERNTAYFSGQVVGTMNDESLEAFRESSEWYDVRELLEAYATQSNVEEVDLVAEFERGYEYRQDDCSRMNDDGTIDLTGIEQGDRVRVTYTMPDEPPITRELRVHESEPWERVRKEGENAIRVTDIEQSPEDDQWVFWDGGFAFGYFDQHSRPITSFEVL